MWSRRVLACWSLLAACSAELRTETARSYLAIKRPLGDADGDGNLEGNMYVARSATSDLASSATGYVFRGDGRTPLSYVHVGAGAAPYDEGLQEAVLPAHLEAPAPLVVDADGEGTSYGLQHGGYGRLYQRPLGVGLSHHGGNLAYYGGGIGGQGGGYSKGSGEAHDAAEHERKGHKGEEGYKVQESFDKGAAGQHAAEEQKGYYGEEGGGKKGHHDEAAVYGQQHKGEKGARGEEYGHRSSHKKGHKTSGFHNVYHKDEFKKEHSFYDDAHASGHDARHGEYGEHRSADHGGYEKKGELAAGFERRGHGKKGEFEAAAHEDEAKGHASSGGAQESHGHEEDFAEKAGRSEEQEHGYDKGHGYGLH